jgi:hypothetical protein
VSTSRLQKLINHKRRIQYRLRKQTWTPQDRPMFTAATFTTNSPTVFAGWGPAASERCTTWLGGLG